MAKLLPVMSAALTAVQYDRETSRLVVQFGEGIFYEYAAVPGDVVLDILFADSIGKAFDALVKKGGYQYYKIPAEDVVA